MEHKEAEDAVILDEMKKLAQYEMSALQKNQLEIDY